jgi:phosphatidylglycerophosphatase A
MMQKDQQNSFKDRIVFALATGFGLGLSPIASGTVGTLWGVLLVLVLFPVLSLGGQVAVAVVLALLSYPVCDAAEKMFDKKDDGRIVADEYLTFPLCMIGLPVAWHVWWVVPMAFLTCRACDIIKPPPAAQSQRLKGGIGVATDDVIASLYSLLINHALYYAILRWWPELVSG